MKTRPNEPLIDVSAHRSLEDLEEWVQQRPTYNQRLTHIVLRQEDGSRRSVATVMLDVHSGAIGDRWGHSDSRKRTEQLAVMSTPLAALIANGQSVELFGDNLFIDADLSEQSMPVGSLWQLGASVLQVSSEPHDGCSKFRSRFGADALRFVSRRDRRKDRLRGVYLMVVESGIVSIGDVLKAVNEKRS